MIPHFQLRVEATFHREKQNSHESIIMIINYALFGLAKQIIERSRAHRDRDFKLNVDILVLL